MKDEYFDYLLDTLGVDDDFRKNYSILLQYLYSKPFRYSIPIDENLYLRGLELRDKFPDYIPEIDRCSVLEMMTALSISCDYLMKDPESHLNPERWFYVMVDSIGIEVFNNTTFDAMTVDTIMGICLDRKFEPNGEGSFFHVPNNFEHDDFRKLSVWSQFLCYANYKSLEVDCNEA